MDKPITTQFQSEFLESRVLAVHDYVVNTPLKKITAQIPVWSVQINILICTDQTKVTCALLKHSEDQG